jgi:hypothetical protein
VSGRLWLAALALLAAVSHAQSQVNLRPDVVAPHTSPPPKPKYCNTVPSEFATRVHLYQGCIASKAHDFEITGDTAESVAIAAIGACADYRKALQAYIDECGGTKGVGERVMQNEEKFFHDWAMRKLRGGKPGADSDPRAQK